MRVPLPSVILCSLRESLPELDFLLRRWRRATCKLTVVRKIAGLIQLRLPRTSLFGFCLSWESGGGSAVGVGADFR